MYNSHLLGCGHPAEEEGGRAASRHKSPFSHFSTSSPDAYRIGVVSFTSRRLRDFGAAFWRDFFLEEEEVVAVSSVEVLVDVPWRVDSRSC